MVLSVYTLSDIYAGDVSSFTSSSALKYNAINYTKKYGNYHTFKLHVNPRISTVSMHENNRDQSLENHFVHYRFESGLCQRNISNSK